MRRRPRPMPAYKLRRKRAEAISMTPLGCVAMAAISGWRAAQRSISSFDRESDALYARAAQALMAGD